MLPTYPSAKERVEAPLLENGYHLNRDEFERRYELLPMVKRAELVGGIVYMGSPVTIHHGEPHARIMGLFTQYAARTPFVRVLDNATYRIDEKNEFQPDAIMFLDPSAGGAARIDQDKFLSGAPELICEVALSSYSYDLFEKKEAYFRAGVREYLVWQVEEQLFSCFVPGDRQFLENRFKDGIIQSASFPGLAIDVAALLAGQMEKAFDSLSAGLRSAEYRRFKERLNFQGEK